MPTRTLQGWSCERGRINPGGAKQYARSHSAIHCSVAIFVAGCCASFGQLASKAGAFKKTLAATVTIESRERVLHPEDFVTYLDELDAPKPVEHTVRGYRVKISYTRADKATEDTRRQAISQVLLRGRKRVKENRVDSLNRNQPTWVSLRSC